VSNYWALKILPARKNRLRALQAHFNLARIWAELVLRYIRRFLTSLRPLAVALFLTYSASVATAGILSGIVLQYSGVPQKLLLSVNYLVAQSSAAGAHIAPWRDINTNLHLIQVAAARISNVGIDGGSIAEVGGNIVIASTHGQLSYLDTQKQLHALDLRVPMNMDALRRDPLYKEPLFNVTFVRTHGLLAIRTGTNTYDLYATFNRFAGRCFEFVVSRVSLETNDQAIIPTSGWQDLWIAKPCVRLKDRGSLFAGLQSGGRMVRWKDDVILISVGDHQFDGFYDSQAVSMDPASDLGKLIELNVKTGISRHFASGLRNPQGLVVTSDGHIWETEHGPQGGDEVNLMVEGRNYGWPIVTYGMSYGEPPKNWPFNPKPGRHDGYARPRFAFVPSIGISNIVTPDPREFPYWSGDLLVCSLRANTLYVLRVDGEDIVYAEPISIEGYRLRDVVSMPDGSLAILADRGTLLFVRNAEVHQDSGRGVEITGLSSLPQPLPDEAPQIWGASAAERGRQYFLGACANCHSLAGQVGAGPPLNGVIGRQAGTIPKFGYSAALKDRRGVWTVAGVSSFISNPKGAVPGSSMPETGIYVSQAWDIAAFLKTTH